MNAAWHDLRISGGMRQQLRHRRELLESGEEPLGWKLAFGGPAAMGRLHINAPLVGFLLRKSVVPSNSAISLRGWTKPAAEPELTVYLGKKLPAGSDRTTAISAT
jgi:2-keto-4-pentenoate hydratase